KVILGSRLLVRQHVIGREEDADVGHVLGLQDMRGARAFLRRRRKTRLDAVEPGRAEVVDRRPPIAPVAPQGAENLEFHHAARGRTLGKVAQASASPGLNPSPFTGGARSLSISM